MAVAVMTSAAVSAHRLDEYLQAVRIGLEPGAIEIDVDLTPGVAVADSVITLIDTNVDGSLSADEQRAYARQVMSDLKFTLDGEPLVLQLSSMEFPDASAFRRGEGMIQLRARAEHRVLSAGSHQLHIRNTHQSKYGAYLANALIPASPRVSVTAQHRDGDQRELTIDYAVRDKPAGYLFALLVVSVVALATLVKTVRH